VIECRVRRDSAGGGEERERRKRDIRLRALCPPHTHALGYIGGSDQEEGVIECLFRSDSAQGQGDAAPPLLPPWLRLEGSEREIFIDNVLVRVHWIIEMVVAERPCAMGV